MINDHHSNLQWPLHEAQRGFSVGYSKRQRTLAAAGAGHRWDTHDVCKGWLTTPTSTRQTILKTQMVSLFCEGSPHSAREEGAEMMTSPLLRVSGHPTADTGCRRMRRINRAIYTHAPESVTKSRGKNVDNYWSCNEEFWDIQTYTEMLRLQR